jgi:hypothetical protein
MMIISHVLAISLLLIAQTNAKLELSNFLSGSTSMMQSSSDQMKTIMTDFTTTYKNLTDYFNTIRPEDSSGAASSDPDEIELPPTIPANWSNAFTKAPASSPVSEPTPEKTPKPTPQPTPEPTTKQPTKAPTPKPTRRRQRKTPAPVSATTPSPPTDTGTTPSPTKRKQTSAPTGTPVEVVTPTPTAVPVEVVTPAPVAPTPTPPTTPADIETFYVIGDVPYNDYQAQKLIYQMDTLPKDAEFVVHVGDIRYAGDGSECTLEYYESVAATLKRSFAPVFIIMGDNEWNDCPNADDAWTYWHQVFKNFEDNWNVNFTVVHPEDRTETFYFVHKDVLHIGLNMVGGKQLDRTEWSTRLDDQQRWVKALIQTYMLPTIMFGHGDPKNYHAEFFTPFVEFIQNTLNNQIPIYYFNGDGHQ